MPTRLIREELLDSDRYWSVSNDARLLFVHMLLLADDFGCVGAGATFIRRRCFNNQPTNEQIAKLLNELQDADLIRLYEADRACFAFIPRFRQRLQRTTLKHAKPPESLIADDAHAKKLFQKINDKTGNPTVENGGNGSPDDGQPPKRREEKRSTYIDHHENPTTGVSETSFSLVADATDTDPAQKPKSDEPDGFAELWAAYPKRTGSNPRRDAAKAVRARLLEGYTIADMLAGTRRYAEHLRQTRKVGTEFVMQAVRFYGPSHQFAEPWTTDPPDATPSKFKDAFL